MLFSHITKRIFQRRIIAFFKEFSPCPDHHFIVTVNSLADMLGQEQIHISAPRNVKAVSVGTNRSFIVSLQNFAANRAYHHTHTSTSEINTRVN